MKFRKILLIVGIAVLISVFAINTSFGASSEKITKFDAKEVNVYNEKVSTITKISRFDNNYSGCEGFKVNIKSKYRDNYKIKTVKAKIFQYNDGELTKSYYKTYNFKNKNTVYFKLPKFNSTKSYYLDKMTIFYKTKSNFKKESSKLFGKYSSKSSVIKFYGKKSNILLKEKGHIEYPAMGAWPVTTYQNFQIKTKNPKYKINNVKIVYYNVAGIDSFKTIKGHGKNKLNYRSYERMEAISVGDFIVKYY